MTSEAAEVERWDAVVVGGGVAGLVAARELATAGHRVLVVDGRDVPGGVVRGHTVAGLELDAGAESFATRGGVVAALADELGLTDRLRTPEPGGSWVHLPGGDGPLPRTGLLGIPSDPGADDVRRTLGALGARRARLDLVLPARVGAGADSLGALVRARMGRRALDRLVRPIVGGVHAAEPDDLAVDAVAPGLRASLGASGGSLARAVARLRAAAPAGTAVQGIDGGMHVLVDALAADVEERGGTVRTRARVLRVDRDDAGYRLAVSSGPGLLTKRLVVATPDAPALLADVAPTLAGVRLDEGALVTLVTLVLDEPALDGAPRGTGVLVAREARDVEAKALTHATAKWGWLAKQAGPGRHVLRLSYGRADELPAQPVRPGPASGADRDGLVAQALRDASVLLGVPLGTDRLVDASVVRWSQALPRPSAAHQEAVAAVRTAVAALPGVAVCGAWVAGNGLASVVPDARDAARALARREPF